MLSTVSTVVVLAAVAVAGVAGRINGPIRHVVVAAASHYDAGRQVGNQTRDLIERHRQRAQELADWITTHPIAAELNQTWYSNAEAAFPWLVEELHGIAAGSGMPFELIWNLNLGMEFYTLKTQCDGAGRSDVCGSAPVSAKYKARCTDVFSWANGTSNVPFWGHNEDSGFHDINTTFLLTIKVPGQQGGGAFEPGSDYTAYCYVGTMGGNAFGWNANGLFLSTNALFAHNVNGINGIPRVIHNRALLGAKNYHDAVMLAHGIPSATAFSMNVAMRGDLKAPHLRHRRAAAARTLPSWQERIFYHNTEVDITGAVAETPVFRQFFPPGPVPPPAPIPGTVNGPRDHLYHANDFLSLNTTQDLDTSSIHRVLRLRAMPVPHNADGVRQMLGDTHDAQWPIYRNGAAPDLDAYTIATVLFRFDLEEVHIYNDNPKTSDPVAVLPFYPATH